MIDLGIGNNMINLALKDNMSSLTLLRLFIVERRKVVIHSPAGLTKVTVSRSCGIATMVTLPNDCTFEDLNYISEEDCIGFDEDDEEILKLASHIKDFRPQGSMLYDYYDVMTLITMRQLFRKIASFAQESFTDVRLAVCVRDYSGSIAKGIAAGSGQVIIGILWCGYVIVDRLKWGDEFLKRRMEPCKEESEVSRETLRRIKRIQSFLLPHPMLRWIDAFRPPRFNNALGGVFLLGNTNLII
ncbi:hypothetical protein IFM89_000036 [Coptis chinensis]|uniref:Senescence domain-containing protein n=1 Tax=Coptis chinensis TaxID=261450 RepID=A0A835M3T3_9MAGN|nr:hypothetical protein IFM89_000036 [Coptis chinensis]